MSALLDAAVDAAVAGGRVLSANWRNLPHGSVEEKKKNDFVTLADRESEERIVGILRGRFPGDAFLGEEGGTHGGGEASPGARVWIIDPLDGTSNFVSGFPFWCVSIAAREGDDLVAAVVWDPLRDEMYTAERGGGAWRNGTRLSVTGRPGLDGAFVATGHYRSGILLAPVTGLLLKEIILHQPPTLPLGPYQMSRLGHPTRAVS